MFDVDKHIQTPLELQYFRQHLQDAVSEQKIVRLTHRADVFYIKNSKQLFRLIENNSEASIASWVKLPYNAGKFKEIKRVDWNYILYKYTSEDFSLLMISAVCGRSAVFTVNHILSADEQAEIEEKD